MAGHGEALYEPHDLLASHAPNRFDADEASLQACIDEINRRVVAAGEEVHSPALAYGIRSVEQLNERLQDGSWPLIMVWDGVNHQLKNNLGGLGINEESSK